MLGDVARDGGTDELFHVLAPCDALAHDRGGDIDDRHAQESDRCTARPAARDAAIFG
jgi:hypothetical protein